MSKKHFIALANAIKEHNRVSDSQMIFKTEHLETLARFCKSQNYAFMRDRWFDYIDGECGPNGGKI